LSFELALRCTVVVDHHVKYVGGGHFVRELSSEQYTNTYN